MGPHAGGRGKAPWAIVPPQQCFHFGDVVTSRVGFGEGPQHCSNASVCVFPELAEISTSASDMPGRISRGIPISRLDDIAAQEAVSNARVPFGIIQLFEGRLIRDDDAQRTSQGKYRAREQR